VLFLIMHCFSLVIYCKVITSKTEIWSH